jgi:hypothetical protein
VRRPICRRATPERRSITKDSGSGPLLPASWRRSRERDRLVPRGVGAPTSCFIGIPAESGQLNEARAVIQEVLAIDPPSSLARSQAGTALSDPDAKARYLEGLRQAGLPE